jgi:hypothetical protein
MLLCEAEELERVVSGSRCGQAVLCLPGLSEMDDIHVIPNIRRHEMRVPVNLGLVAVETSSDDSP